MKDLLTIADLGADGINEIMLTADSMAEVSARPIPKVPALRGKTVASMFSRTPPAHVPRSKPQPSAFRPTSSISARRRHR